MDKPPGGTTQPPQVEPVTLADLAGARPGLALSGGGTKGDFEVGVARYLYDQGVRPKVLSGTSVGAINALKLAEGEGDGKPGKDGHRRGLPGLEVIWRSLRQESDMWTPDPKVTELADKLATFGDRLAELKAAGGGVESAYTASLVGSALGLLPPPFSLLPTGLALANLAAEAEQLETEVTAAVNSLMNVVSFARLDPIRDTMFKPASFQPSLQQASGIKLRLAMVALEDGQLRYATETGVLVERDGTPTTVTIVDPKCADPIRAELNPLVERRQFLRDQLADSQDSRPDGKPTPAHEIRKLWDEIKDLTGQIADLEEELANCPRIKSPVQNVDLRHAALASSSIPVVFPPQWIAGLHYVDGGVRTLVPIEPAIHAGATMVFAVAASSPKLSVKSFGQPLEWLQIALRTTTDIMIDEIGHRDLFPALGFAVPVLLIRPEEDIHGSMTIDPGLIDIRKAHGYMRADDTAYAYIQHLQKKVFKPSDPQGPYGYLETADHFSSLRKTTAIVQKRRQIWEAEFAANGKQLVPGSEFPPEPPTVKDAPAPPGSLAKVRELKRELKELVERRIAAGGKCPAGYERWWSDWEAHNWTPNTSLRAMKTKIEPTKIPLGKQVKFTVHAWNILDDSAVTDATVAVDGATKGKTGEEILFTFKAVTDIDIDTHGRPTSVVTGPEIIVSKAGYPTAIVPVLYQGK